MTAEPKWLQIALAEIGVKETPGPESTPRILTYWRDGQPGWKTHGDDQPWCSVFLNWCMAQAGIRGTGSPAARSWLTWGVSVEPRVGAVTVVHARPRRNGLTTGSGYHVALWMGQTDKWFTLLGGNQSNSVKTVGFPKDTWELLATRWPESKYLDVINPTH